MIINLQTIYKNYNKETGEAEVRVQNGLGGVYIGKAKASTEDLEFATSSFGYHVAETRARIKALKGAYSYYYGQLVAICEISGRMFEDSHPHYFGYVNDKNHELTTILDEIEAEARRLNIKLKSDIREHDFKIKDRRRVAKKIAAKRRGKGGLVEVEISPFENK